MSRKKTKPERQDAGAKEAPGVYAAQLERLFNEVYVPAFVQRCADRGIQIGGVDELKVAMEACGVSSVELTANLERAAKGLQGLESGAEGQKYSADLNEVRRLIEAFLDNEANRKTT